MLQICQKNFKISEFFSLGQKLSADEDLCVRAVSDIEIYVTAEKLLAEDQQQSPTIEIKEALKRITVERLRKKLGNTGSNSRLAEHLKDWKKRQQENQTLAEQTHLPRSLIVTLQTLWQQLKAESQESILKIEQACETQLKTAQQNLVDCEHRAEQQQQQLVTLTDAKTVLEKEVVSLTALLQDKQKENNRLCSQHDKQTTQLQENQLRIEELNRHAKQSQQNLEHYREETSNQRQELQEKIHHLEQQCNQAQKCQHDAEKNCRQLTKQVRDTQEKYEKKKSNCDALIVEAQKQQNLYVELQMSENTWQAQANSWETRYQDQQKELKAALHEKCQLDSEVAQLRHIFKEGEKGMELLETANQQLTEEKLKLIQEKASLTGQLAALEKQFTKTG